MIKIAICDDQKSFAKEIYNIVQKHDFGKETEADCFYTGKELLEKALKQEYDIIILDIELSKENAEDNGMYAAAKIKKINPETLIIFISGYGKYFKDLVQFEPFRFIEKNVNKPQFKKSIYKAVQAAVYRKLRNTYTIKKNHAIHRINLNEVLYVYSAWRKATFHFDNGTEEEFYHKLDDIENDINKIQPNFIRLSKSYLINMIHVKTLTGESVKMKNNETIRITTKYKEKAIPVLIRFLFL